MKDARKRYEIMFGNHLRTLLEIYNKDVFTIAAHGSLEPKQVYRVINAEHSPSLGVIFAIAKGLDIHPKILFDFDFETDDVSQDK